MFPSTLITVQNSRAIPIPAITPPFAFSRIERENSMIFSATSS